MRLSQGQETVWASHTGYRVTTMAYLNRLQSRARSVSLAQRWRRSAARQKRFDRRARELHPASPPWSERFTRFDGSHLYFCTVIRRFIGSAPAAELEGQFAVLPPLYSVPGVANARQPQSPPSSGMAEIPRSRWRRWIPTSVYV